MGKEISMPLNKIDSRWKSGVCRICGMKLLCVTHSHAQTHGFKTAEEMIAAGKVKFDRKQVD
jgi:hypothetical protein